MAILHFGWAVTRRAYCTAPDMYLLLVQKLSTQGSVKQIIFTLKLVKNNKISKISKNVWKVYYLHSQFLKNK